MKLAILFTFILISTIYSQVHWETCPPEFTTTADIADQIVQDIREKIHNLPDPLEVWAPMNPTVLHQAPIPECAYVLVPLNWNNPQGSKIKYFIRRFKASPGIKKGLLWIQNGGPGASGLWFLGGTLQKIWIMMNGTMDIILPDHRGTGWSTSLDCPQYDQLGDPKDPQWKDCFAHVERNQGELRRAITVTQAVQDIHYVVDLLHEPGMKKYLYGVSYGTYVMNRYLQLYPNHPDAVVFDSTCPPKLCRFIDYFDYEGDKTGKQLLMECKKDAFCNARMPDPLGTLENVFAKIRSRAPCVQHKYLSTSSFGRILMRFIRGDKERAIIPALLYRINRCNSQDANVIKHFFNIMFGIGDIKQQPFRDFNMLTLANIGSSELHTARNPPPTREEMERIEEEKYHFRASSSIFMRALLDVWKNYTTDQYWDEYYKTQVPYLLMQGMLDPQTPYWFGPEHYRNAKYNEYQNFVGIPTCSHAAVRWDCGLELMKQFLENPKRKIDLRCTRNMPKFDFAGVFEFTQQLAEKLFGQKKPLGLILVRL